MPLTTRVVDTLSQVEPTAWDALLAGVDNPFVEHAFLAALEESASVGSRASGWLPRHILIQQGEKVVGAAPVYEKHHSYGEYIFDWGWAHAAERAGIAYYPKLVGAVPLTPATGPRLLVHPKALRTPVVSALSTALRQLADDVNASSVHVLFNTPTEQQELQAQHFTPRTSFQFHWQNQQGWCSFDDYLAALRAPVRKQIRKERHRARGHGLSLSMRAGCELTHVDWQALWQFYRSTASLKGAIPYLTEAFFQLLPERLAHRTVVAMAHQANQPVAAALFFHKGAALYGRYWGASQHFDALHFELCYYLPIEWCLSQGMTHFEAGAQGEHKLKRGFLPQPCHSSHWIRHPQLAKAVSTAMPKEAAFVREDMELLRQHSPFRKS